MPLRYGTRADTPPNLCMECGVQCRRPKRFCTDDHKETWLSRRVSQADPRGITQVAQERQRLGITPQAIEWRQKLSLSRPF